MPTPPPRRADLAADDPWGFGASDGTLVSLSHDTLEPAAPGVPVTTAANPHPAREPAVAPTPPSPHMLVADPPSAPAPAAPSRESVRAAGTAAGGPAFAHPFAPRQRSHRLRSSALAVGVMAVAAAAGYLWFVPVIPWPVLRGAPVEALPHGEFVLSSQPPGAEVLVDGISSGVTPVALRLTAGNHTIVATAAEGGSQQFAVAVPAGETASRHLVFEAPPDVALPAGPPPEVARAAVEPPAPDLPGFVTLVAPFDVQLYENGNFLGSGASERVRVPPGRHVFTLVNDALGYRVEEVVNVGAGRSVRRLVNRPSALLSVNAEPWADVFISGKSFGETPLANISLPVGHYQLTLRHPTLGDREIATTVRADRPNRLAVDMRR